jgi:hypothetical protein
MESASPILLVNIAHFDKFGSAASKQQVRMPAALFATRDKRPVRGQHQ